MKAVRTRKGMGVGTSVPRHTEIFMKILKHGTTYCGNIKRINNNPTISVRFMCPYCGCHWECEPHECVVGNETAISYHGICPECRNETRQYTLEMTY